MQLISMIELPKYDLGLKKYIEEHGLEVRKEPVGRYTKLTLEYPPRYRRSPVEVIHSKDYVLGTKSRLYGNSFLISIASVQIRSIAISFEPDININICAREISQECPSFESFLTLNPFYLPKGTNNARVTYTQHGHNGTLTPEFFYFGHDSVVGFHNGTAYLPDWGENKVQISRGGNGSFTATRDTGDIGRITAKFPESITPEPIQELEQILATETDWLEIPRRLPILQYSRSIPLKKLQANHN